MQQRETRSFWGGPGRNKSHSATNATRGQAPQASPGKSDLFLLPIQHGVSGRLHPSKPSPKEQGSYSPPGFDWGRVRTSAQISGFWRNLRQRVRPGAPPLPVEEKAQPVPIWSPLPPAPIPRGPRLPDPTEGREGIAGRLSPGLRPLVRADSRGPHRLSPAATSSSCRGPIVPRLSAARVDGPAFHRLALRALSLRPRGLVARRGARAGRQSARCPPTGGRSRRPESWRVCRRVRWRVRCLSQSAGGGGGGTPARGRRAAGAGKGAPRRRVCALRRWQPAARSPPPPRESLGRRSAVSGFGDPAARCLLAPPPPPPPAAGHCPAGESKRDSFSSGRL